ncbi:hypothetical protein MBORA_18880 [Methanobrevibacter oralis]|uniref:Uncharacterized protein n=1 Tax=Methanobrevibacter oralis TaxID=66851 RepID=A0A166C0F9_METOA|nr:hypothetical protein MBORA_18880 [Methanobrevibacter oralis]
MVLLMKFSVTPVSEVPNVNLDSPVRLLLVYSASIRPMNPPEYITYTTWLDFAVRLLESIYAVAGPSRSIAAA